VLKLIQLGIRKEFISSVKYDKTEQIFGRGKGEVRLDDNRVIIVAIGLSVDYINLDDIIIVNIDYIDKLAGNS